MPKYYPIGNENAGIGRKSKLRCEGTSEESQKWEKKRTDGQGGLQPWYDGNSLAVSTPFALTWKKRRTEPNIGERPSESHEGV